MRYSKLTGYAAIVEQEAEKTILAFDEAVGRLKSEPVSFLVDGTASPGSYEVKPGATLGELIGQAGGIPEGRKLKAIHLCYPIGGLLGEESLDIPIGPALLETRGLHAGDLQIKILCDDTCIVDYLASLTDGLMKENCGRCTFCREGLRQMLRVTEDITRGKSTPDDLPLLQALAEGMLEGSHCLFGRSLGAMYLQALELLGGEVEAHIKRKRCEAMVCKKYITYHILGSKCQGCEKCLDACPQDAIEGEEDYIHVIDQLECDRCGKCAQVCEHEAIVKAGAIKPKTPDEPVPVGSWKGR